jgi:hypothetical protein
MLHRGHQASSVPSVTPGGQGRAREGPPPGESRYTRTRRIEGKVYELAKRAFGNPSGPDGIHKAMSILRAIRELDPERRQFAAVALVTDMEHLADIEGAVDRLGEELARDPRYLERHLEVA